MKFLFLFLPLAWLLDRSGQSPAALTFAAAALAIVPLSALMVDATEQLSHRTGQTVGGLLNATFGNAPELIISLMALRAGLLDVVKASIVGVVLGNLLFVLGLSFLIGGLKYRVQKFNRRGARVQRSMLMLAVFSMVVPSLFDSFVSPEFADLGDGLNLGVAWVLLTAYALNLVFMLKTHPDYFEAKGRDAAVEPEEAHWPVWAALGVLLAASVALAFMSEILVGTIEPTARSLHMSKAFIGVIVIALVGGAPESVAAVAMARKNKLDLTMGIAVGSSIQIALFVAPTLMLSSYFLAPKPLNLVIGNAGMVLVLLSVLIFSMIVSDGKSNWFKGVQLLSVYLLIALFCYYLPDSPAIPWIKP
ncbi:calcium/proton exchanger [Methylomagnum ishizawai]|uniref:calcium/proton exchanger n=1 Tax=Methylomagnum ishizawai TaxID=1760988 RepID=UPI001C32CFD7|nr:calcium/proton exchanger [Methylomagnum ishizawai]BBL77065.1 calcium/proton exchanger [Methylomagnum ishizawai]